MSSSSAATIAILLIITVTTATISSSASAATPLNVHLVCHTHDDVGWLKTVDEYYMGANNSIQHAGVQYILDSVMVSLKENPARKFVYVEIAFFERWWAEQTPATQALVKSFVQNGQLEFINGGWCMNDEAATHYVDIVDQMARGHAFLLENFGVKPTIGWHIDPFGHSSVQASLFAQMGFNAFFFARIDYDDMNARLADKRMEFVWRGSPSLGKSVEMFTNVLYHHYGPPPGFCFDQGCDDTPIQDDPRLFNVNVKQRADAFVAWAKQQASHYNGNDVMFTMGSDFQYENANTNFKNIDKLIAYINANPDVYGVNVFYSTPSQYVKAKHDSNITWTVKTDDFFPYADCPYCYWTGYFVSRPALKGYVRDMSSYLQVCRQFEFLDGGGSGASDYLWHAMGVAQHHDAVAGTEKQHVAYDYAERLSIGEAQCNSFINTQMSGLSGVKSVVQCALANETICDATSQALTTVGNSVSVMFWNPSRQNRTTEFARIPVPMDATYSVECPLLGSNVPATVLSTPPLSGRVSSTGFELVFPIYTPALGYNTYVITLKSYTPPSKAATATAVAAADFDISNEFLKLTFDGETNMLKSWTNLETGVTLAASYDMLYYNSSDGNNVNSSQASGAYIFRPNGTEAYRVTGGGNPNAQVTTGAQVSQVIQTFADWASVTVRLYAGQRHASFEYQVGPIPVYTDGIGKEVIVRFTTPLNTAKTWYTDSNGREMRQRIWNYRETWKFNDTEAISGNYVPINSAIYMEDTTTKQRFTVVTDRSQGGASESNGELEVMLHRRTLHDDARGVGEPINEPGITGAGLIIRTRHSVFFTSITNSSDLQRAEALRMTVRTTPAFTPTNAKVVNPAWSMSGRVSWPPALSLETLQQVSKTQLLVRIAHMFEVNESTKNSRPFTVDLAQIIDSTVAKVTDAVEYSLSANQLQSDVHRLQWLTDSEANARNDYHLVPLAKGSTTVTIAPMEIRTFLLTITSP